MKGTGSNKLQNRIWIINMERKRLRREKPEIANEKDFLAISILET